MKNITVKFFFESGSRVELVRTEVQPGEGSRVLMCVRGKTSGAYAEYGSFQWTSGVRGVCAALIRFVLSRNGEESQSCLAGGRSSMAASLDYALSKGPSWLSDMFGIGRNGSAIARRLFKITNPNRKRPGPVVISVNSALLRPEDVGIFFSGRRLIDVKELSHLLLSIESQDAQNDDVTGDVEKKPLRIANR